MDKYIQEKIEQMTLKEVFEFQTEVSNLLQVKVGQSLFKVLMNEPKKTQLTRKDVVTEAKADIEKLKDYRGDFYLWDNKGTFAYFIINREKRTVVCLLKGMVSNQLYSRGIAKCLPEDCFNEHIGKAIALRRALGKDVPEEYYNTPQPEGVQVGDVIKYLSDDDRGELSVVANDDRCASINKNTYLSTALESVNKVLDDSNRY